MTLHDNRGPKMHRLLQKEKTTSHTRATTVDLQMLTADERQLIEQYKDFEVEFEELPERVQTFIRRHLLN